MLIHFQKVDEDSPSAHRQHEGLHCAREARKSIRLDMIQF